MKNVDIDLLDAYFSGSLDDQQQKEFDQRLKADPAFKELFDEYSDLHLGVSYSTLKSTKENLQVLEASMPEVKLNNETGQRTPIILLSKRSNLVKIAAAILVLAISTVVLINYQQSQPEALYAKNFEPYPNEFVSVKRGEDLANTLLLQAFQAYDREDYQAAIADFKRLLEEDTETLMVLFYLGNAQLANGESTASISSFEQFLETSQGDFINEAKWYLVLGYLKEERKVEALKILREIEGSSEYGKRASGMIKKLE